MLLLVLEPVDAPPAPPVPELLLVLDSPPTPVLLLVLEPVDAPPVPLPVLELLDAPPAPPAPVLELPVELLLPVLPPSQVSPQTLPASATQAASHFCLQQWESTAQTFFTHGLQFFLSFGPSTQTPWLQWGLTASSDSAMISSSVVVSGSAEPWQAEIEHERISNEKTVAKRRWLEVEVSWPVRGLDCLMRQANLNATRQTILYFQ